MNSQTMIDNFLKTNTVTECKTGDKQITKPRYSESSKEVRKYVRELIRDGVKMSKVWSLSKKMMKQYSKKELSKRERIAINRTTDRLLGYK